MEQIRWWCNIVMVLFFSFFFLLFFFHDFSMCANLHSYWHFLFSCDRHFGIQDKLPHGDNDIVLSHLYVSCHIVCNVIASCHITNTFCRDKLNSKSCLKKRELWTFSPTSSILDTACWNCCTSAHHNCFKWLGLHCLTFITITSTTTTQIASRNFFDELHSTRTN